MLEALVNWDTECFRWINGHYCTAMDWTMWTLSQHWCWVVVLVLFFALVTMRKEPRHWWIVLCAVVLCFLLADQGSVHIFKDTVCRLRPCHALEEVRMFHTRCGGQYGFVSSHAANAFAIAMFLFLRYRHKTTWGVVLMFVWAFATSYSRIYLGKHYPGDILCGAMFGMLCGWVVWMISIWIEKKKCIKSETK